MNKITGNVETKVRILGVEYPGGSYHVGLKSRQGVVTGMGYNNQGDIVVDFKPEDVTQTSAGNFSLIPKEKVIRLDCEKVIIPKIVKATGLEL